MTNKTKKAFTLVEIMIVVSIIGILATMAVPAFRRTTRQTKQKGCINNLRIISGAKQQYSFEHNIAAGTTLAWGDISGPGEFLTEQPECPSSGTYSLNAVGTAPTCDIPGHQL